MVGEHFTTEIGKFITEQEAALLVARPGSVITGAVRVVEEGLFLSTKMQLLAIITSTSPMENAK